jgi:hypothetical protein
VKRVALVVAAAMLGASGEALADEHAISCDAAFEASELQLRPSETHLLQARDSLRACALPTCKAWMVDDCTKRLVEVEGRIPSVVFSADNGHGTPIYDVRVLEGDRELAAEIDGRAVEMDPGPHVLVAEHDGAHVPLNVVVIEGKKAQQVVFAFPPLQAIEQQTRPSPIAPIAVSPPPPRPEDRPLAHPWARPLTSILLIGGVSGLSAGAVLGLIAISRKSDASCNSRDVCQHDFQPALDTARASTISLIAGAALLGAGIGTYYIWGRTRLAASFGGVKIGATW